MYVCVAGSTVCVKLPGVTAAPVEVCEMLIWGALAAEDERFLAVMTARRAAASADLPRRLMGFSVTCRSPNQSLGAGHRGPPRMGALHWEERLV
ncbi:hypothetical protein NDU88_000465 [Pleurodeles waltl]|uniref:Uncharacterized protein n=1 Tax=Pleurodeles waltl TaxID=8319 RepID=A0AAV7M0A9_PLEWA|nr:hypothetical protein NDU88_000465 [Pleurodeles waltl]